jgi:carboxypeptidase C (cathepsin A)
MRTCTAALILVMACGAAVRGQTAPTVPNGRGAAVSAPATQGKPAEARTDSSVTTGGLRPSGRPEMAYTAVAGYLPLKDETEKLRANMFFTAYTQGVAAATMPATGPSATMGAAASASAPGTTAAGAAAPPAAGSRPVMFVFNGGPGAAAVWLHLAVGPKRLDMPEDGTLPKVPFRTVDNEYSWLTATDLVFIDPVNTGYSRAATPEQAKEFFGVQEDISSVGEFIRLWLTKNQRWGSPVFLAGESYGTTRAAGLSNYLQERVGVSVSGVVLISTVLNFATLSPGESNDLPFALYLPSYAAVASYHKKVAVPQGLDALLKDAETFALGDYAAALAKGAALPEAERQRIAQRVADLTGLGRDYVLESNLRVPPARFEKELLRDKTGVGKVIGRFDGRLTGFTTDAVGAGQEYDPSLTGFYAAYTSAFNDYVRQTLKYDNDLTYEVLSNRTQPWNFSSGGAGGANGYLYVGDDLREAMTHNPRMRLLVCSGRFDLATPYFATDYTLNHLTLAPEIRKNITEAYYPGGHMLYHVREGMAKLYRDVTGFVEGR